MEPDAELDAAKEERRLAVLAEQGDLEGVRKALTDGVDPTWQVLEPMSNVVHAGSQLTTTRTN